MARYGAIHENLLFEIMVSSYCIVFCGVHKCKNVTALIINHGLYFSNPGSYKPGLVHCSKTQTKPHQNRGSDQVYTDQVSAWFNGGLNHGLDHCSKIGPISSMSNCSKFAPVHGAYFKRMGWLLATLATRRLLAVYMCGSLKTRRYLLNK